MSVVEQSVVTKSYWQATSSPFRASLLRKSRVVDVCIIGGGITGLSLAYQLSRAGASVAVVDAGKIGGGETGVTTAHLVTALDHRWARLVQLHGEERARRIADSHRAAIDAIARTTREEGIDCDFEYCDGYLIGTDSNAAKTIEDELQTARTAGVDVVADENHPFRRIGEPCVRFGRQAKFHPLKYLNGISALVKRNGGHIHHNTRVQEFIGGKDAHVVTESGVKIHAKHVVVATNSPVNDIVTMHTKLAPYRTYVVGLAIGDADSFKDLVWDTDEPFHYVRCHKSSPRGRSLLIAGGEDHKTGQADPTEADRFERLEQWTRDRFPGTRNRAYAWSGQVLETLDGIAYIGRNPGDEKNVYIATGDCGDGMTHGTIAGLLLTELIQGRDHPWAEVYDPSRTRTASTMRYVKENLNVALQYTDWLTPGELSNVDELPRDSGAIVRRGLKKLAIYRDGDGQVHELSATCTHLNCVVSWNTAEKSWDCPCHGSRFAPTGEVLTGPAIVGLKPAAEATDGEGNGRAGDDGSADGSAEKTEAKAASS